MRLVLQCSLLLLFIASCGSESAVTTGDTIPPVELIERSNTGSACVADSDCDDENPCTHDICLEESGCAYAAAAATCDDGDPCTVGDTCIEGSCDSGADACGCRQDADCAVLDDGNVCNGGFICNTETAPYACAFDPSSIVVCTGDVAECEALECNPATGDCETVTLGDGTFCEDGDACSGGDQCVAGQCMAGATVGCDDQECGITADGCDCGTCGLDAICTPAGACLASGDACGDIPPEGQCQDDALVRCQNGALSVEPCGDCCGWNAELATPECREGSECRVCVNECEVDSEGCSATGAHAWTCQQSSESSCLVRVYSLCDSGPCSVELGACVDLALDADDDTIPDALDNCLDTPNAAQLDADEDGVGDVCDDDDDGDGVLDVDDNCPTLMTTDTTDTDSDGIGDACDLDDDGDGVLDTVDNCPLLSNNNQADTDGDLTGDACDEDDDGDTIPDIDDNCPLLADSDTTDTDSDGFGDPCDTDDDGDGVLDAIDNCPGISNVGQTDSDGDALGDACDPDVIACFTPGIELVEPTVLPATVGLGEFTIVASSDSLVVRHADEPNRDIFAPPSDGTWLHLAQSHLKAEEHQGSFKLEEEIFTRCELPVISDAYEKNGSLLLMGGFADDIPECAEATWQVRLCEAGDHRLTMNIVSEDPFFDLVVLRADSSVDEHIWGAGEQFPHDSLNLKGRNLPIIAQEGGLGRGQSIITPAVNQFSEGSGGSEDSTYIASAHYLTSEARSIFLENTETAFFDFTGENAIELRLYAGEMDAQIVHGTEPLELIERFTDWTGRMIAPPSWANEGAIVALARPLDESLGHVDALLDAGAALAAVWNQTWSGTATTYIGEQVLWNWVLNKTAHPGWFDWVEALDDRGLRVLCYVNTMFRELPDDIGPVKRDLYQEGMESGYFVHDEEGMVLKLPVTAFDVALLDFTNADAREWMKAIIQDEMVDYAGCSGWMADFAEALPFEAVMSDGSTGDVWHNRYPVEWAALNREALQEVGKLDDTLVFNRSGHTRTPGAALTLWQGDQLVTWDKYDGLVSAIHGLISGGFSGLAINHSDIGGYTSMGWLALGYSREGELLKRWAEMAAFTSLMRTHEGNQPPLNAQVYSDQDNREHFAKMTRVYRALGFYRTQLFTEATTKGWPVVRHLLMHWPEEEALYDVSDQFLLGSEILVAPIKNKCFTWPLCPYNKEVVLPPGQWVHLWTGATYGDTEAVSVVTVAAPLGEPAVFYPVGSAVGATFVANLLVEGIEVPTP